jgi:hypothetical protein
VTPEVIELPPPSPTDLVIYDPGQTAVAVPSDANGHTYDQDQLFDTDPLIDQEQIRQALRDFTVATALAVELEVKAKALLDEFKSEHPEVFANLKKARQRVGELTSKLSRIAQQLSPDLSRDIQTLLDLLNQQPAEPVRRRRSTSTEDDDDDSTD